MQTVQKNSYIKERYNGENARIILGVFEYFLYNDLVTKLGIMVATLKQTILF